MLPAYEAHRRLMWLLLLPLSPCLPVPQKMLEYEEYRRLTPDQKIALLERGECPAGISDFLCPFWWNHWKVSVNFNWDALRPVVQTALKRLAEGPEKVAAEAAERHKALAAARGARAPGAAGGQLQQAGGVTAEQQEKDRHNRSLSVLPPGGQQATATAAAAGAQHVSMAAVGGQTPSGAALLDSPGTTAANGVPLSSYQCAFDNGQAANRLCVFNNLLVHGGQIYYVAGGAQRCAGLRRWWPVDGQDRQLVDSLGGIC